MWMKIILLLTFLKQKILTVYNLQGALHNGITFILLIVSCTLIFNCTGDDSEAKKYLIEVYGGDPPEEGTIVIIPTSGCSGCISRSIDFMRSHIDDDAYQFIVTGASSKKELKFIIGTQILSNKRLRIDFENIWVKYGLQSVYPLIIEMRMGKVSRIQYGNPENKNIWEELSLTKSIRPDGMLRFMFASANTNQHDEYERKHKGNKTLLRYSLVLRGDSLFITGQLSELATKNPVYDMNITVDARTGTVPDLSGRFELYLQKRKGTINFEKTRFDQFELRYHYR